VALDTGAGSGIGRTTALLLASEGAAVVAADVDAHAATATATAVADAGGDACPITADLRRETEVQEMVDSAIERYGRIDILHNNPAPNDAGAPSEDSLAVDISADVWDRVIETNLRGSWLCCKLTIPHMTRTGGGSIINRSSGAAVGADVHATAYGCSMAGINALTLYVATQYGAHEIRCNAVMPGLTLTPAAARGLPEPTRDELLAALPIPRFGEWLDEARLVLFLASDESSWISGQLIEVDGASSAQRFPYSRMRAARQR
jgi:NAD(P)-dependent dehydrogenase (short-subunit alcohol dehydrogenase family)